jgi:DNA-binding MarR family transcriptional regulator
MAARKKTQSRQPPAAPARWLTAAEEETWRNVASVLLRLPWALECQLQRDADLSFIEYHALARLSETPGHTRRMSELAGLTHASLSRLSHMIKRLEARGFVRREPDPTDGRYTNAVLTPAGHEHLLAFAPAHVATVRQLVIDAFTMTELGQLDDAAERILRRLDQAPADDAPRRSAHI